MNKITSLLIINLLASSVILSMENQSEKLKISFILNSNNSEISEEQFKDDFSYKKRIHQFKKCNTCGQLFKTNHSLDTHIFIKHKTKNLTEVLSNY